MEARAAAGPPRAPDRTGAAQRSQRGQIQRGAWRHPGGQVAAAALPGLGSLPSRPELRPVVHRHSAVVAVVLRHVGVFEAPIPESVAAIDEEMPEDLREYRTK